MRQCKASEKLFRTRTSRDWPCVRKLLWRPETAITVQIGIHACNREETTNEQRHHSVSICPCSARRLPQISSLSTLFGMNEVTRILSAVEQGDPKAAERLLPLVYEE